jgi:hypothetical protein
MASVFIVPRATSRWNHDDPLENGRLAAHIGAMTLEPKFHSKMVKSGRWTVTIATGYGPSSYVGDFATEEEADHWISTNSKDWPHPADKSK